MKRKIYITPQVKTKFFLMETPFCDNTNGGSGLDDFGMVDNPTDSDWD